MKNISAEERAHFLEFGRNEDLRPMVLTVCYAELFTRCRNVNF